MEKINDITCFFFGFDDELKNKVIASCKDVIKRGREIHEVWVDIGKRLEESNIENVAWVVQTGVAFYRVGNA